MRIMQSTLLAMALTACGPHDEVKIEPTRYLSTDPLPITDFRTPQFGLSAAGNRCAELESFFNDYARVYLQGLDSSLRCETRKDAIYSEAELQDLRARQIFCGEQRSCYKAVWTLGSDRRKDVYYALVVRFEDQVSRGLILPSPHNYSSLTGGGRDGDQLVPGQLLHEGLAPLEATFATWAEGSGRPPDLDRREP